MAEGVVFFKHDMIKEVTANGEENPHTMHKQAVEVLAA